ncbi:hypothetical protein AwDysgo_00350 [Bacteroidales bacterium]|nr:hypothetical protein AwDysgo_00350 [Bacteroidales bacterium]
MKFISVNKIYILILLLGLFLSSLGSVWAILPKPTNMVEELTRENSAQGKVEIFSEPGLTALIGKLRSEDSLFDTESIDASGYRVNIFSGNNQRKSKDEAFSKEMQIKELFPGIRTTVSYKAPVWRLRVGDFESREHANGFMRELKQAFPGFGKEVYIVEDEIKISYNDN